MNRLGLIVIRFGDSLEQDGQTCIPKNLAQLFDTSLATESRHTQRTNVATIYKPWRTSKLVLVRKKDEVVV